MTHKNRIDIKNQFLFRAKNQQNRQKRMTHFVDKYMEDDIIYRIIGFIQDNIYLLASILFLTIASFISGKIYGIKTQSVIYSLKERYANIELQKKKLRNQIHFLASAEKVLKKLVYVLLGFEIILISNMIYHRGFDYSIIINNTLSRNLILGMVFGMFVSLISNRFIRKHKESKRRFLATIDSGMNEIARKLVESLGPELTKVLKAQLLTSSIQTIHTRTKEVQTDTIKKEPKPVTIPPEVVAQLNGRIEMLEKENMFLRSQSDFDRIGKDIDKKDLGHHQAFLKRIQAFEWCDNCLQYAENHEVPDQRGGQENKNDDINSPEKTHPAAENNENSNEEKPSEEINKDKKEEKEEVDSIEENGETQKKGECQKECLKRYFELGFEISEKFNREESELEELREKYKSITKIN